MKTLLIASFFCGSIAQASVLNVQSNQTYVGQEYVNDHATGNTCYVQVNNIENANKRGLHCNNLSAQFLHNNEKINKEAVLLYSRVTNNHRPEYPQVKTCAMNIDGTTSGNEIYGMNTETLYNSLFSASGKNGTMSYDYFLTISPETKLATRSRIHMMSWFTENNIDCVHLKPLN